MTLTKRNFFVFVDLKLSVILCNLTDMQHKKTNRNIFYVQDIFLLNINATCVNYLHIF